jgi:nitrate reductase NapE component
MNSPDNSEEQQRQIKIDADIDEIVKTIQGLGLKPDEKTTATDSCGENPSPRRNRWMRLAVITVTTFAIGAFAGFVGAYTFNALNGADEIRVSRSPEIRRATPVEPEVRRAIPVEPEIRKAIAVEVRAHFWNATHDGAGAAGPNHAQMRRCANVRSELLLERR